MIKRFTITGADNSVQPLDLLKLWEEFPFVEWGILVSRKQFGNQRFPSIEWIHKLSSLKREHPKLPLSMHMCGAIVREVLKGELQFIENEMNPYWHLFERVQLNTHGEPHVVHLDKLIVFLAQWPSKEFIFQYDNTNIQVVHQVMENTYNGSTLFDLSHGAGVLPSEWPKPLENIRCGYAGGLSPENLKDQIKLIESEVGDTPIWIDMETHVRSHMDQQFDLTKVRRCLEIAKPFIVSR